MNSVNGRLKTRGGVENIRLEKRTQKNPRPRTAFPRTDTLEAKDRNARGQEHKRKCSPKNKGLHRNFLGDLKKKRKVFTKIFQAISTKKRFAKNFSGDLHKILTIQKVVLS